MLFPAEIVGMTGRWCKSVPRLRVLGLIGSFLSIGFLPVCASGQEAAQAAESLRREPDWQTVEAADATACRVEGKNSIQVYPRSVGRQSVFLFEGARLTVSTRARAVYLRLPTVFATPGPRYSDFGDARLRLRIDERPWQEFALATARQEWPIAEDLPVLNVPRSGPAPLRVNFTAANDGKSSEQTAVITNEYPQRFPRARIRFLMRAGRYRLEGGRTLQAFQSDAGTTTVIDAEVDLPTRTEVTVAVRPD